MAPALFSSTGLLTIPSCEFDFARNPTCYPGVRIENETDRAAREVQGSFGTVSFATPPLQIEQLGEERLLQPGESLIADRSTSPIHLRIHASDAKVFDFKLSISPVPGPSTEVGRELDLSSRLKTYSRIAALSDEIQQLGNATGPDLVVRAKTLATAIHLLSASAVNRQYLEHLKVELKNRAAEIIALDDQVLQLRDVILANSQMTPDEIDRLIARVESLVETVPPSEREALLQIRTELQVARDAVGSTTSQIAIFRERFYTWIDKIITRYQGTVLEYAQYVSVDEIERGGPISSGDLNTILRKVRAADVFITDSVFGGRGAQLRSRFGLPDPVR